MSDEAGRVFWYNRRWHEYTGTVSEPADPPDWWDVQHPDEVARVRAGVAWARLLVAEVQVDHDRRGALEILAQDRRRVREAGFDDHLTKPVEVDDLTRVLERSQ